MMKHLVRFAFLCLIFIFYLVELPNPSLRVKAFMKEFTVESETAVSLERPAQLPSIRPLDEEILSPVANPQQYGDFTKLSDPVKVMVTTARSGLNVRRGPSTRYSKIRVLPLNSRVDVLEKKNGWLRISKEEWIYARYTKEIEELDNNIFSWYYIPNITHQVPAVSTRIDISKYNGSYTGDTNKKVVYLTFNLDHEAGHTSYILDTLKAKSVEATFFISRDYLSKNAELVRRMVKEGHLIGSLFDMRSYSITNKVAENRDKFNKDILDFASEFKAITGKEMTRLLRPSVGNYSELSLYLAGSLGYKTIFWSFAYYDYDEQNQPLIDFAFSKIVSGTHNGAILLLNGNSRANSIILNSVITIIEYQGFEF
jgi:peptidoglycan-N-acetylmuramic acid deacetylase